MVQKKLVALEGKYVEEVLELLKKIVVLGNAGKVLLVVGHMMMVEVV